MVARLKAQGVTTPSRLPFMMTISPDSMATSMPVPMAMPTSAWARAGASLMPSPTMATFGLAAEFHLPADFSSGRTRAMTSAIPAWGNGAGGFLVVAGQHDHLEIHVPQAFDVAGVSFFIRSATASRAQRLSPAR